VGNAADRLPAHAPRHAQSSRAAARAARRIRGTLQRNRIKYPMVRGGLVRCGAKCAVAVPVEAWAAVVGIRRS